MDLLACRRCGGRFARVGWIVKDYCSGRILSEGVDGNVQEIARHMFANQG